MKIRKVIKSKNIKPSSITLDFNKNVNPKIIQRKARHRKIETTLRYDHVSDDMVREYFEKQKFEPQTNELHVVKEEKQNQKVGYV